VILGKGVCVVARQQRVPELVASLRDRDTDTCRQVRAISSRQIVPRFPIPCGGLPAGWRVIPQWFDPLRLNLSMKGARAST
jgi:hypothetical protein